MIKGVFAIADRTASTIMTPRREVVWLDLTRPAADLQQQIIESGLSRFPAAEESLDHFLGIVDVKDLLAGCFAGVPIDVRAAVREAPVFPERTSALQILHEFQKRRTDVGIVVDEYGGFEGLVTVSDLATRILGLEESEHPIVRREDGSWLVDAMMNFDDFADALRLHLPDDEEHDTVAGFVLAHMGRLPRPADRFDRAGHRFEVVDMDGRRIDKILVSRLESGQPPRSS